MAASWLTETDLPPDIFAVVMATGIVSIAAQDHRYPALSLSLAIIATVTFVGLALGLLLRIVARPASALGEVRDPDVALRLFTSVAAATVLGVRFIAHPIMVWLLGALALTAWLILTPLAIWDVRARPRQELRDHAHGAWLLPSVATAGLATTAADLAIDIHSVALTVIGLLAWLIALVIYLAVTYLIAGRALASPFVPEEVTPDSWILMGALSITTVAADHLLDAAAANGGLPWLTDWLRPATTVTWTVAALWIPILLYAEMWRVDQRSGSLHYAGVWWSAVFPLGMFAAATSATATQLTLHRLVTVSLVFFWVAFTVWLLVATGLIHLALNRRRAATP